jgi:NAD(P)-dependent dehydrogenase (short-subunit alcohol dehydrogenase family)
MNPPAESSPSSQPAGEAAIEQRFAGKVALVTGASDRGIGGEIAVRLAREGAAVAIISRSVPQRLMKKLNRFDHGAVHTAGDVTKTSRSTSSATMNGGR